MAQLLGVLTLSTTVVTGEAHSNHAAAIKHAFADVPLLVVIEAADSAHKLWDELHQAGVCAPADRCRRVKVPSMVSHLSSATPTAIQFPSHIQMITCLREVIDARMCVHARPRGLKMHAPSLPL